MQDEHFYILYFYPFYIPTYNFVKNNTHEKENGGLTT